MTSEHTQIVLPADALVLLIGPAGSGKSTFAARHFPADAVLSSDTFRGLVSANPADQSATDAAFRLLHETAGQRVERGLLTVIDATNVQREAREALVELAERRGPPLVAIVFDLNLDEYLARNQQRPANRVVPRRAVRRQHSLFQRAVPHLQREGFRVVRLRGPRDIAQAEVKIASVE